MYTNLIGGSWNKVLAPYYFILLQQQQYRNDDCHPPINSSESHYMGACTYPPSFLPTVHTVLQYYCGLVLLLLLLALDSSLSPPAGIPPKMCEHVGAAADRIPAGGVGVAGGTAASAGGGTGGEAPVLREEWERTDEAKSRGAGSGGVETLSRPSPDSSIGIQGKAMRMDSLG